MESLPLNIKEVEDCAFSLQSPAIFLSFNCILEVRKSSSLYDQISKFFDLAFLTSDYLIHRQSSK